MTDPDGTATIEPLRMDLLARIGVALLTVQTAERALRLITTFVLQKSGSIAPEELLAQSETERRKTLGYFLAELRKRAAIDPHFDATLAEFLRRRNTLVHNLSDFPGWDIHTHRGIHAGGFVNELIGMTEEVLKVFAGLVRAWQIQIGEATMPDIRDHDFFREVDAKYVPMIDDLFFPETGGQKKGE
jgi:hypothetical protein